MKTLGQILWDALEVDSSAPHPFDDLPDWAKAKYEQAAKAVAEEAVRRDRRMLAQVLPSFVRNE